MASWMRKSSQQDPDDRKPLSDRGATLGDLEVELQSGNLKPTGDPNPGWMNPGGTSPAPPGTAPPNTKPRGTSLTSAFRSFRGAPGADAMDRSSFEGDTELRGGGDAELGGSQQPGAFGAPSFDVRMRAEKHHRALVVGLLKGRAVWRDNTKCCNVLLDYWFYLCQIHPLLCLFFAHPAHPFRRMERFLHLCSMLFFAFFIAALSEVEYKDMPVDSEPKIVWLVCSNVALVAIDMALREMGTCSCIQAGGCCECLAAGCGCAKDCADMGSFGLKVCTAVAFVLACTGLGLLGSTPGANYAAFTTLWLAMKLLTWASNVLIAALLFYLARSSERPTWGPMEGAAPKKAVKYPLGPAYPSRAFLAASFGATRCSVCACCAEVGGECGVAACGEPPREVGVGEILGVLERRGKVVDALAEPLDQVVEANGGGGPQGKDPTSRPLWLAPFGGGGANPDSPAGPAKAGAAAPRAKPKGVGGSVSTGLPSIFGSAATKPSPSSTRGKGPSAQSLADRLKKNTKEKTSRHSAFS